MVDTRHIDDKKDLKRLTWLEEAWRKQSLKLNALGKRWDNFAQRGIGAKLFNKIAKLMDQIGIFKEKERKIISEIDAIEQKHRYMRDNKLLRRAKIKPDHERDLEKELNGEDDEDEDESPRRGFSSAFVWAMVLLGLSRSMRPRD